MQETTLHIGSVQRPTVERKSFNVFFQLFPCLGGEVSNVHNVLKMFVQVAEDYFIAGAIGTQLQVVPPALFQTKVRPAWWIVMVLCV